jgi:hypothetical protein
MALTMALSTSLIITVEPACDTIVIQTVLMTYQITISRSLTMPWRITLR